MCIIFQRPLNEHICIFWPTQNFILSHLIPLYVVFYNTDLGHKHAVFTIEDTSIGEVKNLDTKPKFYWDFIEIPVEF